MPIWGALSNRRLFTSREVKARRKERNAEIALFQQSATRVFSAARFAGESSAVGPTG